jgi:nucleoside-diphosphate-sugar epimerase
MAAGRERVLITGAGGFLGANLARAEAAAGHEVHLFLRTGGAGWRLAGLDGLFARHAGDLRDAAAVRRAVEAARPDVVYHLAAHGAHPSLTDRTAVFAVNLLGTANLLDALRGRDYRALVHAGSSSEYGHKDEPMREDDRLDPRTDYAVGKAAATLLVQAEGYRGRPTTTVRVFSAYGPWENPGRIASYVMGCCLRGEAAKVTHGGQPRDFVCISDVTALLRAAADAPAARGRILHAGTGRPQTVRDMVEAVIAHCGGRPAEYGAEAARADEPAVWRASIARTTALTGWRPAVGLAEGVARTWEWFRAAVAGAAAA